LPAIRTDNLLPWTGIANSQALVATRTANHLLGHKLTPLLVIAAENDRAFSIPETAWSRNGLATTIATSGSLFYAERNSPGVPPVCCTGENSCLWQCGHR
jgi:hypothetical protein